MTTGVSGRGRGTLKRRARSERAGVGHTPCLVVALSVLALACGTAPRAPSARPTPVPTVADRIRARLADAVTPADGPLALADSFYAKRGFRPAWTDERGLLPRAAVLLATVCDAAADGLEPHDYPLSRLLHLAAHGGQPDSLARFEVLASQTFLIYAMHLSTGRVRASEVDALWIAAAHGLDLGEALERAVREDRVAEVLSELRPAHIGYERLRTGLARYREIARRGGWPAVAGGGAPFGRGRRDPRVPVLRERLHATGDLVSERPGADELYDSAVGEAVRRFQSRHGMEPTGVVDSMTLEALNVPVEARILQIALNLERWRWLPRRLGDRYVWVNAAAHRLELVDSGRVVLTLRVLVGRPDWPTPILSTQATGLTFRPSWTLPREIVLRELLPLLAGSPEYLVREGIRVWTQRGGRWIEVHPDSLSEEDVRERISAYRFIQAPGPTNPLGGLRLRTPNCFAVYLHDTPARHLFDASLRSVTHGCVRVEGIDRLAAHLLRGDGQWTEESVRAAMEGAPGQTVDLVPPVPVHLVYFTAIAREDGVLEFRPDIYGWDRALQSALRRP